MWRAMMLCDVIGEKASCIARRRDFQSIAVLLAQAPARVIQMIKDAETGDWLANAPDCHILLSASPTAGGLRGGDPGLPVSVSNAAGTIGALFLRNASTTRRSSCRCACTNSGGVSAIHVSSDRS